MKKIAVLFVFLFFVLISYSQTNEKPNYIGLNAGYTTGFGLSYEYWPKKNGIQITFLPLFSKEEKRFSLGLTYLRNLTTGNKINLILFFGNHFTNFFTDDAITNKARTVYNVGIGPGIKGGFDSFMYQFMIGYAVSDVLKDYNTALAIEFGFFYNF